MELLEKKRVLWADYAKFVAIYLVVLGHTNLPFGNFRNFIYLFHLPLFFLISGYFDNSLKYSFKSYLFRNIKWLIIPYICFNIINIPISWTSVYLHPELYPGIDSFGKLLLCPLYGMILGEDRVTSCSYLPCGPLWFLVALFIIKICFYFFYRFTLLLKNKFVEILYWLFLFLLFVLLFWFFRNLLNLYSLDSAFLSMPFYMMGFLMKKVYFPIQFREKTVSYIICILICIYMFCFGLTNGFVDINAGIYGHNLIMFYLSGLLGSYLILVVCGLFTKPIKFVQYIGANTIIVLGMHLLTIRIVKFFMFYVLGISLTSVDICKSVVISIVAFVLCFPFVLLVNRFAPWLVGKNIK